MRFVIVLMLAGCTGAPIDVPEVPDERVVDAPDFAPATFTVLGPATCPDCDGFPAYRGDGGLEVNP